MCAFGPASSRKSVSEFYDAGIQNGDKDNGPQDCTHYCFFLATVVKPVLGIFIAFME